VICCGLRSPEEQEEVKGQVGRGHDHNCDRHGQSRGLFQRSPRYDAGDLAFVSTLVELLRAAGDLRRARKELVRNEEAVDPIGDVVLRARERLMLGTLQEDSGDLDGAMGFLSEAEEMLRGVGTRASSRFI